MNLNGELDDGEAVLQVIRGSDLVLYPQGNIRESASLSFRPIGTLASATPRRILVGTDGTQSVCVAIDGFVRVLPSTITCQ
jgi:hypothetical protein